jgi:hypothetical protein
MSLWERKPGPEERLADGIVAVTAVLANRQYSGSLNDLWRYVREAVKTQQSAERKEAQDRGKKPKMDAAISWMATTADGFQDFIVALGRDSVMNLLTLRGYSVTLDREAGTATVVPLSAAADSAREKDVAPPLQWDPNSGSDLTSPGPSRSPQNPGDGPSA